MQKATNEYGKNVIHFISALAGIAGVLPPAIQKTARYAGEIKCLSDKTAVIKI